MPGAFRPIRRALILEDDADLRETICELFALAGVDQCLPASSFGHFVALGEERIRSADLAVLDVNLGPGGPSGIDAYLWLRAQNFPGRIVFLTGHARSHPLVLEARDIPGVLVLEKPVDSEVLEQLAQEPVDE